MGPLPQSREAECVKDCTEAPLAIEQESLEVAAIRGPAHWFLWSTFITIGVGVIMVRRTGVRFRGLLLRPASR